MRVLTIYCPECGEKAMIKKSNPLCGHTFVLNLTFSHTLSPSAKKQDALLLAMIKNLSPQQREKALTLLQEI